MSISFNQKEVREYERSLSHNLFALAHRGNLTGMVREVHDTLSRTAPKDAIFPETANGLLVPIEAAARAAYDRALATGTYSAGGAFLGGTQMTVEQMLRPVSIFARAGARFYSNLTGNVTFGREDSEGNFTWLHELETGSASDPTVKATRLSPRRLLSSTKLSNQLDTQSEGRVKDLWLGALGARLADALDYAGFQGDGLAQPQGLFNRSDTNTVTFSAAATWAKVLSFESQLVADDVNAESIIFAANPDVRAKWGNVLRFAAGSDATLWDIDNGTVAGRTSYTSSNVPTTKILAMDASKTAFGLWGESLNILVNPFSSSLTDQVELTVSVYADFGPLNVNAVCICTDSANQ